MFRRASVVRVAFSFVTVWVATFLFGFFSGFGTYLSVREYDSLLPHLMASTVLYAGVVTVHPFLWFVFALAVANHAWLGHKYQDEQHTIAAAS